MWLFMFIMKCFMAEMPRRCDEWRARSGVSLAQVWVARSFVYCFTRRRERVSSFYKARGVEARSFSAQDRDTMLVVIRLIFILRTIIFFISAEKVFHSRDHSDEINTIHQAELITDTHTAQVPVSLSVYPSIHTSRLTKVLAPLL